MASTLSKEDREYFEDILAKYEPYADDDPEFNQFDGDGDPMRGMATIAKNILDGKVF